MTDTQTFIEFKDFVYLQEGFIQSNIITIVYLKVFEDLNKKKYLGILRIGLFTDYDNEILKACIKYLLSINYPTYSAYELEVTKI